MPLPDPHPALLQRGRGNGQDGLRCRVKIGAAEDMLWYIVVYNGQ